MMTLIIWIIVLLTMLEVLTITGFRLCPAVTLPAAVSNAWVNMAIGGAQQITF